MSYKIEKTPNGSNCLPRFGSTDDADLFASGQGNTTRMLAEVPEPADCIGLDYDSKLVAYASVQAGNGEEIQFVQRNAMPFDFPKKYAKPSQPCALVCLACDQWLELDSAKIHQTR